MKNRVIKIIPFPGRHLRFLSIFSPLITNPMKKTTAFTIVFSLLASIQCFGQTKKEEIAQKVIGTWQFSNYWNSAGPDYVQYVSDTCQNLTTYTFNQDGTASIQSKDKSQCKMEPLTYYWSVVSLHDASGFERQAIRLTEEKMAERESYDGNTWNDIILMIVTLKKKSVRWVEKPQYYPANLSKQSVYNKS